MNLALSAMIAAGVVSASPVDIGLRAADPTSTNNHFDREIAPLLARRCLECHNGEDKKGGLNLATSAGSLGGGDSGPAIVAGDPDASLLWARIDADEMPPKHPLPTAEREAFRAWISDNASWGAGEIDRFRYSSDSRAGYDWWALQPVKRSVPPARVADSWSRNEIDRFIWDALTERGLTPAGDANRAILIRRVCFDLTGLPPTPAEIDAFVRDESADAYERLVDRLLTSPQYGVRWARHWLDVVRFGESNGFEYDEFRADAWPYRDWVVDALNNDLPYDDFVRQQLAGDVLHPTDLDGAVATGFLTAGAYDTAGQGQQSAAMRAVVRQDELEDLVGTICQSFLGMTVNCARCHDHKFDPIRQREYYAISAAISGVRHGVRDLQELQLSGTRAEQHAALESRRNEIQRLLATLEQPVRERLSGIQTSQLIELQPIASWEFTSDSEAARFDKLELFGGAKLTKSGLLLEGETAYAATLPLDLPLREKTLEVWVKLADTTQRGGGAMSVQTLDGAEFDAIVFAERDRQQWMAGSNGFARTRDFGGSPETEAAQHAIHFCITYAGDGTITAYREGQSYGKAYRAPEVSALEAGKWQVLFGLRHSPPTPGKCLSGAIERARLYDRALTAEEVALSSGNVGTAPVIQAHLAPADRDRHVQLSHELRELDAQLRIVRPESVYASLSKQPEPTHLLSRGDAAQPLAAIGAGGIASLAGVDSQFGLAPDAPEAERRIRLARWITDRNNPLFVRVLVNRVWHYHFGQGLVETPNDLGFNGGRPSNPLLLDWLAAEFIDSGFRLKALHRLIVTSSAYRQNSQFVPANAELDFDNRLLWRKSPLRLEAEAIRDSMLAVAGVLDSSLGGPGFREMKMVIAPGTNTFLYSPDDPTRREFKRRTLYRVWARSGRNALLDVLDCPDPSTTAPKRTVTTTPLQALALLNNAFVLHLADQFAERLAREAGTNQRDQIELAYRLALGRRPD